MFKSVHAPPPSIQLFLGGKKNPLPFGRLETIVLSRMHSCSHRGLPPGGNRGSHLQVWRLHREVCCLPGAQIRDVTRKNVSTKHPLGYYPFLLFFHISIKDVATGSLRPIKRFWSPGKMTKGFRRAFSSTLPAMGK